MLVFRDHAKLEYLDPSARVLDHRLGEAAADAQIAGVRAHIHRDQHALVRLFGAKLGYETCDAQQLVLPEGTKHLRAVPPFLEPGKGPFALGLIGAAESLGMAPQPFEADLAIGHGVLADQWTYGDPPIIHRTKTLLSQ